MTIKEVEQATGLERANIRFYEQMGLVVPERQGNGYRNYSQTDTDILLKIKLLRGLDLSLDEIGRLKDGSENLEEALSRQLLLLEKQQRHTDTAKRVCRQMQEDQVTFANMNADKYLTQLSRMEMISADRKTSEEYLKKDMASPVYCPWRRFLARFLDLSIYCAILELGIAGVLLRVNLQKISPLGDYLFSWLGLLLMLGIEPLLLHVFGTTPGKALLGLRVEGIDGERPSYQAALMRTRKVIAWGYGYNIPIYSIYRWWKCYRLHREQRRMPWEEETEITAVAVRERVSVSGGIGYVFLNGMIVLFTVLTVLYQRLAPCRGDLTVEQFVKNFYYFADYNGISLGSDFFTEDGQMANHQESNSFTLYVTEHVLPEFSYVTDGEVLTEVSFVIEISDTENWVEPFIAYQQCTALALTQANPQVGLFSSATERIDDSLRSFQRNPQSYTFEAGGVAFSCDVDMEKFFSADGILIPEGEGPHRFYMKFCAKIL